MKNLKTLTIPTYLTLAALYLTGCGENVPPQQEVRAILSLTANPTAPLTAPISGMDISIQLPPEISVTTADGKPSGQIDPSTLSVNNIGGPSIAFGNYSASTHKLHLTLATTSNTFRGGDFINISCKTMNTTQLHKLIFAPIIINFISGFDNTTQSNIDLTQYILTSSTIDFAY